MNPIPKALEDFNLSIKDDIFAKGLNNTGEAANSLKVVEIDQRHFQSVGSDYIEILDRGRGPGKFAPVDSIQEWVKTKLGITENKELKQVAFLVNRKLAREGSAIFKDHSKGLEIDKKIETLREKLIPELVAFEKANVIKELNKFQLKW